MDFDQALTVAVEELSVIPFFPTGEAGHKIIMRMLRQFVSGQRELRWLVDAAVNSMPQWKGIGELRGLYCTRYPPADRIEASCTLSGYSPEEMESRHLIEHAERKARCQPPLNSTGSLPRREEAVRNERTLPALRRNRLGYRLRVDYTRAQPRAEAAAAIHRYAELQPLSRSDAGESTSSRIATPRSAERSGPLRHADRSRKRRKSLYGVNRAQAGYKEPDSGNEGNHEEE